MGALQKAGGFREEENLSAISPDLERFLSIRRHLMTNNADGPIVRHPDGPGVFAR
ncbi:MAG: hypothetical protein GY789_16350 [Hyphomicrobiales bacterium]|nr:hypothetical protein [Hyphomicrobiales bacterium]MCP5001498.1 hypothetical protein [Hyphomicrobiales bacterium]